MNQTSKIFIFQIIAILFLAIAVVGITEYAIPQNNGDPQNTAQSLSILALALLSIGLFYQNHASKIEKMRGNFFLKIIGTACIVFFGALLIWILWIGQGKIITPIYMAFLAFGLFFGNKVMNSDITPKELELSKKVAQFYHLPMGQLLLFMILLALAGICSVYLLIRFGSR